MPTIALQGLWLFALFFIGVNAIGVILLEWFD
jgi:hypothetical protein